MFDLGHSNYLKQPHSHELNSLNTVPQHQIGQQGANTHQFPLDQPHQENMQNEGKWSLREIMRYYNFLLEYKQLFNSKEQRRSKRIFALMAKHIRSRKTIQCKSHHQKIQKNYRNVQEIISYYQCILSPLKEEWKEFIRTEKRVLINAWPQINKVQKGYNIMEFKGSIRIWIDVDKLTAYDQLDNN